MSNLKFDNLPKEIQDKMLDHQEAQGNKRDPEVFRRRLVVNEAGGGFDWGRTPEIHIFWFAILLDGNLQTFYDRYPSPDTRTKAQPEAPATPDPLWDQMAIQAMAALISRGALKSGEEERKSLVMTAFLVADDFMEERAKRLTNKTKKQ